MAQRKVNCEVYTDRGIVGERGTDGKSAYEQAVEGGYQGTEEEFEQALASDIATVASNISDINTVVSNITDVNTVASNTADISSVANNETNITAVANNEININAVANNETNINAVNANKTNIDTVATNISSVNTAVTNMAAIIAAPTEAANAEFWGRQAIGAATRASTSDNRAEIWSEGTDQQVATLGGEKSAKGWADVAEGWIKVIFRDWTED